MAVSTCILAGRSGIIRDSEILRVELNADLANLAGHLSGGNRFGRPVAMRQPPNCLTCSCASALARHPIRCSVLSCAKDPRTMLRSLVAFTQRAVFKRTED